MMEGCRKISFRHRELVDRYLQGTASIKFAAGKVWYTKKESITLNWKIRYAGLQKSESRIDNVKVIGMPTTIVKMSEPYH